jgi:hypothetical protein
MSMCQSMQVQCDVHGVFSGASPYGVAQSASVQTAWLQGFLLSIVGCHAT